MNIRLVIVLIFVIIIFGGLGIFFMNEQNTKQLAQRINPTGQQSASASGDIVLAGGETVTSSDVRVSFRYPNDWYMRDTTVTGGKGKFGTIVQSFVVQSVPFVQAGGEISDNLAKIDIEIQTGNTNLSIDSLVDCTLKTVTCKTIGIDNEQFLRADAVLNTGMRTITVGTFYDDKILLASALITPGDQEGELTNTVNAIVNSFRFSEIPQGTN